MSKSSVYKLRPCTLFALSAVLVIALMSFFGCGASRQLTSSDVKWVDDDKYHVPEPPEPRDPHYTWNFIHRSFVHPVDRFLDFPRYLGSNEAQNINALGEVPDSSWYTNRHASKRMTIEELITGPCQGGGPDLDGKWTIVKSKTQGVTPGFNIKDERGDVYVIKFDPLDQPEMATAAEVISSLICYAAGYSTPENCIVHFDSSNLVIGDGAKITDHKGKKRPMNEADLEEILSRVPHRPDGLIRAAASKFLSGVPVGPLSYRSRRKDDPNDIYFHKNRRELRGLMVIGSWINHVDARGPNTLDMYVTEDEKSYVKHHLIDFGATLGSASTHANPPGRGHGYGLDFPQIFRSLFTFSLLKQPWDDAKSMDHPAIGFFDSEAFHPGKWRPNYPQPAFMEMTNQDAYWGAKVVMAFTPEDIRAIVKQGKYSDPEVERYIADTLIKRRDKIGQYWYSKVNPLDRFVLKEEDGSVKLHFTDLGVEGGIWKPAKHHYELRQYKSDELLDSGVLEGSTEIPMSGDVLKSMRDSVNGKGADDEHRFFYCKLKSERGGRLSKAVRIYLYLGEEKAGSPKIICVEREG
jgi:hypothetical protein